MRQNARHSRGRRNNSNNGGGNRRVNPRVHSFDSNGPDVRVRGNAFQVAEKYQTLARDATSAGDRVLAESYYQHAEHYLRLIRESQEEQNNRQQNQQNQKDSRENGEDQQEKQAQENENTDDAQENLEDLDQAFLQKDNRKSRSKRTTSGRRRSNNKDSSSDLEVVSASADGESGKEVAS
jgi:uncharacterized protein with von Willebrand factor type A (vWA) domain